MNYLIPVLAGCLVLSGCEFKAESESDNSDTSGQPGNVANSPAGGVFSFEGSPRVGQNLIAQIDIDDADGLTNVALSFQWYLNNSKIPSATSDVLMLTSQFLDKTLHIEVSFYDDAGHSEVITSEPIIVQQPLRLTLVSDSEKTLAMSQNLDLNDLADGWSAFQPVEVSDSNNEFHYHPSVASDGKGHLVAVTTTEYSTAYGGEYDVVFTYSHDNGETWSPTELIVGSDTANSGADESPHVATDGAGKWVITWASEENYAESGSDSDIFYTISTDNGVSWTPPSLINEYGLADAQLDAEPKLIMNGDNWFIAWHSRYNFNNPANSDYDVFYSYSSDAGQSWSPPKNLNANADSDSGSDYKVQVDIEASGFGVIAWAGTEGDDLDIYSATTYDFGQTWSDQIRVNSYGDQDVAGDHDYPSDVSVEKGGVTVVSWYGKNSAVGSDTDPYYAFSSTDGDQWTEAISMKAGSSQDSEDDAFAQLLRKPNGRWIASWVDDSGSVWVTDSPDLGDDWRAPNALTTQADESIAWIIH